MALEVCTGNYSEKSLVGIIQKSKLNKFFTEPHVRDDMKRQIDKMTEAFHKLDLAVDRSKNSVSITKDRLKVTFLFDEAGFLIDTEFWTIDGGLL